MQKKQHEKYCLRCQIRIFRMIKRFLKRKGCERDERQRRVIRSSLYLKALISVNQHQEKAKRILLDLLMKNNEIECQISQILRFREMLKLVQMKYFQMRKLEEMRKQQIEKDWQKKIADRCQEKLKSKLKTAKHKELIKRWFEFQDTFRNKNTITERAKNIFNYQKLKYSLKDQVVQIVETRKYCLKAI